MLSQQLQVTRIQAFDDNYIWLIHGQKIHDADQTTSQHVIIVDPGDDGPVLEHIKRHGLTPIAIFITHHHGDHTGGISTILEHYKIPVYGPKNESIPHLTQACQADDKLNFPNLNLHFTVLDVPGHTRGHIAFLGHQALFIGDTLFAGGCGYIFEGTYQQMHQSLDQLLKLDDATMVYCAHEYTLDNLHFAIRVEPNNHLLQQRLEETILRRRKNKATVPSNLGLEKQTNPFLRFNEHSVIKATEHYSHQVLLNPADVFRETRHWKNELD